ncbi:MAG: transcription termination factor Rho [Eubacteriales bacterium]|nr:transcription termination factor Rho [Eubacteriales bacterium]
MSEYEKLSLVELRVAARKLGIKSVTSYKKQELLDKVQEVTEGGAVQVQAVEEKKEEHTLEQEKAPKTRKPAARKKTNTEEKPAAKARAASQSKTEAEAKGVAKKKTEGQKKAEADNKQMSHKRNETGVKTGAHKKNLRQSYQGQNSSRNYSNNSGERPQSGAQVRQMQNGQADRQTQQTGQKRIQDLTPNEMEQLDSGIEREGILEVMSEGYGFIRCDNYLPGERDIYVAPALIRKYHLRTGDILSGNLRQKSQNEKFGALLYLKKVNGCAPDSIIDRVKFEKLTPIFPNERIRLETPGSQISMRMMDLISPIGKGQRGMIVSQPKTGKTTLLKQVAKAVKTNHPKMHLLVLLIDERPEEVTDIKESILGHNVEVIYSTFDELPENHKRVSEMVIERAKRLVEHGEDVMILLDSITRLARAYNLTVQPSGRTLSGGLDPAALYMPKRFFGAARNMREGGSLTILATALVDTGSKMDDVVFEEFKGTGNMELVLDRRLSEKRVFPAIDLPKSSTRREDLLLTQEEIEANYLMRKAFNGVKSDEAVEKIIEMFRRTKNNQEFIQLVRKVKIV